MFQAINYIKMVNKGILLGAGVIALIICSCQRPVDYRVVDENVVFDTAMFDEGADSVLCLPCCLNSVRGHKEEKMIIGNFTGDGLDTLYVVEEVIDSLRDNMYEGYVKPT